MWAHYADSQQGTVIEFDLSQPPFNDAQKIRVLPVDYDDELVKYDFPQSSKEFETTIHRIASRKKKIWSYEKEVRIIVAKGCARDERFLQLAPTSIVSVTLGSRFPLSLRQRLKTILESQSLRHVTTYLAIPDNQSGTIRREIISL